MSTINVLEKPLPSLPVTEIMLLLVAMFWGTSYGFTKSALLYTGIFGFIAIRFGLTFLLLLPALVRQFATGSLASWLRAIPTGIILLSIFVCEVSGIALTTATNAAVLISLSMIFTAIAETLINRVRVSGKLWLVSLLSVMGVAMLNSGSDGLSSLNSGDWLILGAAILRACMVTATKRLIDGQQISALSLTAVQSLLVCLGALAVVFWSDASFVIPMVIDFWLITAYLILFCTLFAFFAQNYALRKTSPTRVALLMGSEPLFGAIFAVLWLGEQLTWLQILGALVIVGCVLSVSLTGRK